MSARRRFAILAPCGVRPRWGHGAGRWRSRRFTPNLRMGRRPDVHRADAGREPWARTSVIPPYIPGRIPADSAAVVAYPRRPPRAHGDVRPANRRRGSRPGADPERRASRLARRSHSGRPESGCGTAHRFSRTHRGSGHSPDGGAAIARRALPHRAIALARARTVSARAGPGHRRQRHALPTRCVRAGRRARRRNASSCTIRCWRRPPRPRRTRRPTRRDWKQRRRPVDSRFSEARARAGATGQDRPGTPPWRASRWPTTPARPA